ncbi:MAG: hypothetical protein GDA56_07720 [Hormoscilla sp. GM7CHS1pb]|nr:hypothetical protein [Hormoscilla sp. GM7CHS1pb]
MMAVNAYRAHGWRHAARSAQTVGEFIKTLKESPPPLVFKVKAISPR